MTGFARFVRSYLDLWLLIGGAASAVGALLLLALAPGVGGYLPIGLLLDGGVAIGGSIAIQLRRRAHSARDSSPDAFPSVPLSESKPRGPGLRDAESWAPIPRSGIARAAVSVHPGRAALGTWWRRGASGSLDFSNGGTTHTGSHLVARSGGFFSFHSSTHSIGGRPGGPSPGLPDPPVGGARPGTASAPFSSADLDRLFPLEADAPAEPGFSGRAAVPAPLPGAGGTAEPGALRPAARVPPPARPSPPGSNPVDPPAATHGAATRTLTQVPAVRLDTSGAVRGVTPGAASSVSGLLLEAANPVPPHLRGPSPRDPLPVPRSVRQPTPPNGNSRSCGSCTRPLSDFRTWAPCVQCGRPICRRCLGRSFLVGEQGLCWDCSDPAPSPAS